MKNWEVGNQEEQMGSERRDQQQTNIKHEEVS